MIAVLAIAILIGLVFGPQIWVRTVINRHSVDRPDFPGTGGELARHLLDEMQLGHVGVETTQAGDHYDPRDKTVRLAPQHHDGRSLAAVAIAAHEVGHAMQDATGYAPLQTRTRLAKVAVTIERIGGAVMLGAPLLAVLTRSPAGFLLEFAAGIAILSTTVVIHMVTLPVEFDASFNRALRVLEEGRYLHESDMPAVRQILRAAAFTYVAGALVSLLNIARWLRVLRF